MAVGYTRNDTSNNIANGNVINASDLDGEFDAIQSAYDATTGHNHDGTTGGGAPINILGPAQDVVITTSVIRPKTDNTVDLGTSTLEFKDLFIDGTANIDTLQVDESATIAANLTVDTTTFVVDATNNRIGVGTASPSTTLHISTPTPIITLTDTDNPHSATINTNSSTGSLAISADTGNAVAGSSIIFNVDGAEKLRILEDGSVGIGTTTTSAALDVVGNAEVNGDLLVTGNTTIGNASTDTLTVTAQVASSIVPATNNTYDLGSSTKGWKDSYVNGTSTIGTVDAGDLKVTKSTGAIALLQRDDTAISSGELLGSLAFRAPNVAAGGNSIITTADIRAISEGTFDATNNQTKLQFRTATNGAATTRMEISNVGNLSVDTNTLFVDAVNNRVGVNNASPTVDLDVTGTAIISASSASDALRITQTGAGNALVVEDAANPDSSPFVVDTAGNVGVGTTSPAEKLQVNGNIKIGDGGTVYSSTDITISADPENDNAASSINFNVDNLEVADLNNSGYFRFNKAAFAAGGVCSQQSDNNLNLGGGTNPVNDGVNFALSGPTNASGTAGFLFRDGTTNKHGWNRASDYFFWNTGGSERVRLTSTGNLLLGTTSGADRTLAVSKAITGATTAYGVINNGEVQSDVTATAVVYRSGPTVAAAAFTLPNLIHYSVNQGTIGAGATVTIQSGYYVESTLIGAGTNVGFNFVGIPAASVTTGKFVYGLNLGQAIASGGGTAYNIYAQGTAPNYLAGVTSIGGFASAGDTLRVSKNITGATSSHGIRNDGAIQSDVTSQVFMNRTIPSVADAAFTLTTLNHYAAGQGTIGASATVTNQVGYLVEASLIGAAKNVGFQVNAVAAANVTTGKTVRVMESGQNSASGGGVAHNLYIGGSAPSYFAGNVGLGTDAPARALHVKSTSPTVRLENSSATAYAEVDTTSVGSLILSADPGNAGATSIIQMLTDGTEKLRVGPLGQIGIAGANYGTAGQPIVSGGSGATVAFGPLLDNGTYTPTLTAVTNVAASTSASCQWMRVGSTVTVSGVIAVTATAANTDTHIGISLPVASNLALSTNLGGTGSSVTGGTLGQSGGLDGDATNDRARFLLRPTGTGSVNYSFSFTYQVI